MLGAGLDCYFIPVLIRNLNPCIYWWLSYGIPLDFNSKMVAEHYNSYHLTKENVDKLMIIRLLRSAQYFTDMSMKKDKSGIRQKLNKSVIFQGL